MLINYPSLPANHYLVILSMSLVKSQMGYLYQDPQNNQDVPVSANYP